VKARRWFGRRARRDAELEEELRAHLAMAEADRVAAGETPEEAAARARREFGNVARVKEITRETWGGLRLEHLGQDLRFGFRMLKRSPGYSLLAILCLTLGIGANAAVFSWIEGILLRPYPMVAHQERLVALGATDRGSENPDLSWPDFLDFRRNCTLVESFIGDKITGTTLAIGSRAQRASGSIVSANYFDALGVRPVLGRGFEPGEDFGRNAHPVTVISYAAWKDRFQGDPSIIGRVQRFNGVPFTIVGVAPRGFAGTFVGYAMQFWVPASMEPTFQDGEYTLEDRGARWIEGYARLKPGVTREQAQQEISAVAKRLELSYPESNRGHGVRLLPLWKTPFNKAHEMLPTLGILLVVVICVLLIACANVGNLLFVRSLARRREMTVRLALGAGRRRLVMQLLTEGLILSGFSTAGALLVAFWAHDALRPFFPVPSGIVLNLGGELDWRVLVLSAAVCVTATLLAGLVPALQSSRIDLAMTLNSESGAVTGARARARLRSILVLVQVSLSFVLLVGAGLLLRSLRAMRNAGPGFSTDDVLVTSVDLGSAGYDAPRARLFQQELLDRVRALPGVASAAYARVRPFTYFPYSSAPVAVDGYPPAPDEQPRAEFDEVGPAFLATIGIPLVAGREFTRGDDETAPPVAVVNETMSARFWHGASPVGKRLRVKDRWLQVVGVARDVKYANMLEEKKPFFYVPLLQNPSVFASLQLRTRLSPTALTPELLRTVRSLDSGLVPTPALTMREQVDGMASSQKIGVTLLAILGGIALLLASIGLYAVMSYSVSQSKRELALRMALGASASNLLRFVMARGLSIAAGGVVLGAAVALTLTWLVGHLLFAVSPRDSVAFGFAFATMAAVSIAACFVPARRATRTDPARALRE
jgi:macrolide transport system ATP-binding/permease protein